MPKAIPVPDNAPVKTETLEGGLIVEDLKIGEGYEVKPGGSVVALYHGTLKSTGKVFDSAFERGEPIAFPLNGVIQGWQKGVPGMKIGGVRRLTIPSALAYGPQGTPDGSIPPDSDLVFVIQLVDALQFEETKAGEGEAATLNCVAVTVHTITDATGKIVDQSTAAKPYIWFPGEFQAMQLALDGMKPGAKRTIKVPAQMNESAPQIQSARPSGIPLTMEVELIAVRNLPMGRGR
jgi:FKBP-type peptidyl-prolyl cis-trans isomerase